MRFFSLKYYLQLVLVCISSHAVLAQDSLANSELPDTAIQTYLISNIQIEGNQKTKERIIIRELIFKIGDEFEMGKLERAIEESKTNLLKQPLFNYVTIEKHLIDFNRVLVKIIVEERWFIWPQLHIYNNDRNFNSWWQTKDLGRLDYRLYVKQYNVLGLNHVLRVGLSYGYTRELSIYYKNISLDKNQHHFLGLGANYFQQKSTFFRNIDNKQESFTVTENDAIKGQMAQIEYTYRPRHKSKHRLIASYKNIEIADSIFVLNRNFLANNQTINSYFEIGYQYNFDRRDSRGYPLYGNWLSFDIVKTGIGINIKQPINLFHIRTNAKQFYNVFGRIYGAHSLTLKKSLENDQPYYFKRGLGYGDFLRGFEYYVIEGEDYYLSRNTFKFELLPKRISNLKFIPIKKFKKIHYAVYLTTYFDFGLAHEKNEEIRLNNNLSNKLLYSSGIGLDIATYYDRVFRFEYSLNSLGETGFFIHFKVSI